MLRDVDLRVADLVGLMFGSGELVYSVFFRAFFFSLKTAAAGNGADERNSDE